MPTSQMQVVENSFKVVAAPFSINLGFVPTSFHFWNQTQYGNNVANQIYEGEWNQNLPNGELYAQASTAATTTNDFLMLSGGVTPYNASTQDSFGPALTGGVITKATGTFNVVGHGLAVGDLFRVYNNTVMKQIGGNIFQVATVNSSSQFVITNPAFMNTANFSNESAFTIRKQLVPPSFVPKVTLISNITAANPMVVTTASNHGLVVGQEVKVYVPTNFGMKEANGLFGVITAVTAQTFTIGSIDSTAFTAFAWPAVVTPEKSNFPRVVPMGAGPTGLPAQDLLDDQVHNQNFQGVILGTGDGTLVMPVANDVIYYRAIRADINQ
jgi:hypothetical protein